MLRLSSRRRWVLAGALILCVGAGASFYRWLCPWVALPERSPLRRERLIHRDAVLQWYPHWRRQLLHGSGHTLQVPPPYQGPRSLYL
ncbi:MAG: hypothetical protein ACPGUV_12495, partial [Polyangiales bacterium]